MRNDRAYRTKQLPLSPEHLAKLRRIYAEYGSGGAPVMLRAGQETLEELRSGGTAKPTTIARIAARLDEIARAS